MAISRKSLAQEFEAQDLVVEAANRVKTDAMKAYKAQLAADGWLKDDINKEAEAFRKAFARFRAVTKHGSETVMEKEDRVEEIYAEIAFVRATRATRVEIIEEFDPATGEFKPAGNGAGGAEGETQVATVRAASSANSSRAVDGVACYADDGFTTSLAGAEGEEDRQPIQAETPNQSTEQPTAAAEVSTPERTPADRRGGPERPLAAVPPASAKAVAKKVEQSEQEAAVEMPVDTHSEPASPLPEIAEASDRGAVVPSAAPVVEPFVAEYAAPGVVVIEKCPPEGIAAHPFAACWPVNSINVSGGVREPIVKIGKLILDGRGRYFAARDEGIEYPVVQYQGVDPLLDCIRWNLASRKPSEQQRRLIAQKLAKLEPSRADDIMRAFDRHLESAE